MKLSKYYRKSSSDNEVISQAKSLIKTWKKFVPENGDKKDKKEKDGKSDNGKEGNGVSSGPKKIGDKALPQAASATTDDVRLSCRSMLAKALRGNKVFGRKHLNKTVLIYSSPPFKAKESYLREL